MSKNKKKLGYSQYEKILVQLHEKIDITGRRLLEIQNYFIGYLEYKGDNKEFGNWMNKRILEAKDELQKNEQVNEPHMERNTADQG
jgi:hypothetical protein|tara:strand:+ start:1229 stop:1486 length:258 start_codon:yes stop_codon:yes gene_type:complete